MSWKIFNKDFQIFDNFWRYWTILINFCGRKKKLLSAYILTVSLKRMSILGNFFASDKYLHNVSIY